MFFIFGDYLETSNFCKNFQIYCTVFIDIPVVNLLYAFYSTFVTNKKN